LDLSNIGKVESFLTSFSTWGTENSLAEINLERMGVIKGCNTFLGRKLANTCRFVGGRIIAQQAAVSVASEYTRTSLHFAHSYMPSN